MHYLAQLRRATGTASEKIDLDGSATLTSLLAVLAGQHGESFRRALLDEKGSLRPTILVFVNDEQVSQPEQVLLKQGDSVTFLSPIAGGAS